MLPIITNNKMFTISYKVDMLVINKTNVILTITIQAQIINLYYMLR